MIMSSYFLVKVPMVLKKLMSKCQSKNVFAM